jgi:hypothetical protein
VARAAAVAGAGGAFPLDGGEWDALLAPLLERMLNESLPILWARGGGSLERVAEAQQREREAASQAAAAAAAAGGAATNTTSFSRRGPLPAPGGGGVGGGGQPGYGPYQGLGTTSRRSWLARWDPSDMPLGALFAKGRLPHAPPSAHYNGMSVGFRGAWNRTDGWGYLRTTVDARGTAVGNPVPVYPAAGRYSPMWGGAAGNRFGWGWSDAQAANLAWALLDTRPGSWWSLAHPIGAWRWYQAPTAVRVHASAGGPFTSVAEGLYQDRLARERRASLLHALRQVTGLSEHQLGDEAGAAIAHYARTVRRNALAWPLARLFDSAQVGGAGGANATVLKAVAGVGQYVPHADVVPGETGLAEADNWPATGVGGGGGGGAGAAAAALAGTLPQLQRSLATLAPIASAAGLRSIRTAQYDNDHAAAMVAALRADTHAATSRGFDYAQLRSVSDWLSSWLWMTEGYDKFDFDEPPWMERGWGPQPACQLFSPIVGAYRTPCVEQALVADWATWFPKSFGGVGDPSHNLLQRKAAEDAAYPPVREFNNFVGLQWIEASVFSGRETQYEYPRFVREMTGKLGAMGLPVWGDAIPRDKLLLMWNAFLHPPNNIISAKYVPMARCSLLARYLLATCSFSFFLVLSADSRLTPCSSFLPAYSSPFFPGLVIYQSTTGTSWAITRCCTTAATTSAPTSSASSTCTTPRARTSPC